MDTLTDTELTTILNALCSRAAECDLRLIESSDRTLTLSTEYWQAQKDEAWALWHKLYTIKHGVTVT